MCGPLTLAILRDTGIIEPYVNLKDFWLIRPDKNPDIIKRTFPAERFEHFYFNTPINEFDFAVFPLKPGDVLYLYAGSAGTFEHVLVVTRVDEAGRVFSVSNINTSKDNYYIIQEVMLYDPNLSGIGQFYEWTDREKNKWIGLTGYGGFDLWRLSKPLDIPSTEEENALMFDVDTIIQQGEGEWHIWMKNVDTQRTVYQRRADIRVHIASIVKVPISMLVFARLEQSGVSDILLEKYIHEHGYKGRTFAQLLQAMLVKSEEDATQILLDFLYSTGFNPDGHLQKWGFVNTDLRNRVSTAQEIGDILEALLHNNGISKSASNIILAYMAEYTPSDETRLGAMKPFLLNDNEIYNKRASLAFERVIVGDAGIVSFLCETGQTRYTIVLLGYPGKNPTTYESLEKTIEDLSILFGRYADCN
jgi:hypothetical protein